MATLDDLHLIRWSALNDGIPFNPEAGILKFWKQHPELGSPLTAEIELDDGTPAQVFANGIIVWKGDHAELLNGA